MIGLLQRQTILLHLIGSLSESIRLHFMCDRERPGPKLDGRWNVEMIGRLAVDAARIGGTVALVIARLSFRSIARWTRGSRANGYSVFQSVRR